MFENRTLVSDLLKKFWTPLAGVQSREGENRFFVIHQTNNPDNSIIHMLVFASKQNTPGTIFYTCQREKDEHPYVQLTERKDGTAILSYGGKWLEQLRPKIPKPKVFNLPNHTGDFGLILNLERQVTEAAKVSLQQWGVSCSDVTYQSILDRHKSGVEKYLDQSVLARGFFTSGLRNSQPRFKFSNFPAQPQKFRSVKLHLS